MSAPRHDYYQTAEHIVLSVYVRHQPKDDVSVRVEGQELCVSAPALSDAFTLSLWAPVWPEVDVAVVPSKIEVTLRKRESGVMWPMLVADADPDTRRAMVKSFQESGGTALSTNWADVKDKTMSVRAPQGLEARRYEQ